MLAGIEEKTVEINLPTECPACGSEDLELRKDLLFCTNKACSAQSSGKLQKFCKTLKIKGFGPATIDKSGLETIEELVTVTPEFLKNKGFSDTMANKLAQSVKDRLSSIVTVSDFLTAMSIPNIGAGTARKLSHLSVDEITFNKCKKAGLGDVAAQSLIVWVETEWPTLKHLPIMLSEASETKPEVTPSVQATVCITGKLNDFTSRSKAKEFLESKGYVVKSGVTKAVQYLICEDGNTASSSYKKSISAGIPVVTIKQLLGEI